MAAILQSLPQFLQHGFDALPGWQSPFFGRLWGAGKLKCVDAPDGLDAVDELNARLVCAAMAANQRLLIGLPDSRVSRRSAILATGLVKTFVHAAESQAAAGNVLYFGSRIGIRNQLEHAFLSGKPVTSFFQTLCTKGALDVQLAATGPLPRLLCVYSPVDPVSLVEQIKPSWVAIDCDESTELEWLRVLLNALERRRIPTVAWSSNPLSAVHQDFKEIGGRRFAWPLRSLCEHVSVAGERIIPIDSVLSARIRSKNIVPCEITGQDADAFAVLVHKAEVDLAKGLGMANGRLSRDAFLVAYRLLRLLERLPVPLANYEQNFGKYWGLSSVAGLSSAVTKFAEALEQYDSKIASHLKKAQSAIDHIREWLLEHNPPLWDALIDLCIEDCPREAERFLVFNSDSHARIFVEALASQEQTPPETLRDLHIFPMSLTALLRRYATNRDDNLPVETQDSASPRNRPWEISVMGIPSDHVYRRLGPVLASDMLEIVHYPHQRKRLEALIDCLNEALSPCQVEWGSTLAHLAGRATNGHAHSAGSKRFHLAAPRMIQGRSHSGVVFTSPEPLWQPGTTLDALQFLFAGDDGADETRSLLPLHDEADGTTQIDDKAAVTVDAAVRLRFSGGWVGLFAVDQRLNFVTTDEKLKQRMATTASVGDRVLYILGHRQQSLYDLVVSRVHDDPEIQMHLDYIGNWQREARERFTDWTRSGKTIEDLHREMIARGTTIQSGLAIWNWCEGRTLRPNDKEDLRRLADILNLPFTRKCYLQIHRAGDRIHNLHIQLSLRLRSWIKQGAASTEMRDALIDQGSGLTFGDIQDALLVLKVVEVTEMAGPFYCQNLGTIERMHNA